jgi:riboflavin kinase/FMN adenylyltransferase
MQPLAGGRHNVCRADFGVEYSRPAWNVSMPLAYLNRHETPADFCRRGAVTIGNFDGVHLGHASLVRQLRAAAQDRAGPAVVVSFDPHPLLLLAPERFQPLLNTPADRALYLEQAGADAVVFLSTTPELLRLAPAEFFREIVVDQLQARAVVEGFNFHFGRDRSGDNQMLDALCRESDLALTVVPPFQLDGAAVSSSRVRSALTGGDVTAAARLMGRPYRLWGEVGSGQRRGRTLGFPTANLENIRTLVPGDGVYAVQVNLDGQARPGAANVGPNPTFGEHARKVEVHLIDFEGDLYGRRLGVTFRKRLRPTRPFAGPADLVEQLRQDVAEARRMAAEDFHEQ